MLRKITLVASVLILSFGCISDPDDDKNPTDGGTSNNTPIPNAENESSSGHSCYDCAACICKDGSLFKDGECWSHSEGYPKGLCHLDRNPELPSFENPAGCKAVCEMNGTESYSHNSDEETTAVVCYDCMFCTCVNGLEIGDGECWNETEEDPVGLCHVERNPELPNFEVGGGCESACEYYGTEAYE